MLGAIIGDYIGSQMEFQPERLLHREDFELITGNCRFTDDTVMTIATADAILNNKDFASTYKEWGRKYPRAGYGGMFGSWLLQDNLIPMNSFGNGTAMRVSPVSWLYEDAEKVMEVATKSAIASHIHPEGYKGAQAIAACIYMARNKVDKAQIKEIVEEAFGYNLDLSLEEIKDSYSEKITAEMFSCQKSVPEAIICFLEGNSFEDVIRKAVSLGGDTDTQAAIAGSIAEAYYGIPEDLKSAVINKLPADMRRVVEQFQSRIM
jgi:ADP-ribosyl-[dinitrogen reductase] hydrolase